ncbi:MAG: efflux RND transporter permease subunit [Candidatus Omnitrophica bacterium]|nr:efflux RND transporter permease subunit [Candidatus Omnitrophota bacterium]MBL7210163.1 efflux RND transporter permease subunit [Candidatus Omnitrophota bacterium]
MTLSDISIKRPVGVFVLTLMVVVLGVFFLRGLSVDLLPRITYPLVRIIIDWKGASPEEIEENILKKVEASVATTEDAIQVISSAIEGNASIEVYFEYGKDMDVALADTRAKLDLVRNELPPDADEPKIYKADPSQLPILDIALSSETKDERALRDWAENDLSNYFLGIPGLGAVVTSGGRVREIQVLFNQEKVQKYELSTEKILDLLRLENIEFPAGRISDTKKEYSVRVLAKFKDASEIGGIIIANREGRFIKVKDVAEVADSYEEQRVLTRFNGKPCVTLSFLKQPNANTVEVVSKINKRANELLKKKIIPDDVNYAVASSQSYYIENSIKNVGSSAVIGGILAMLAIWFFLHNIKRTLVIAIAIPVSILGTFILMGLSDVTLNIFSLGGLVLAVGMLVDNSIVMLENITRHQSDAANPLEAAHVGSKEVTSALIASTLTNLAAIVPFFFIKGIASLLFRDMVVTVTVAFIISLFVSLTVVPCLSAHLFKSRKEADDDNFNKKIIKKGTAVYRKFLKVVLRHRGIVIGGVTVLFIASILLAGTLGREFLPQIDDGKISVKVKLPVGSALEKTDAIVRKLEGIINTMPGVKKVYSMVGGYWQRRNVYEKANESDIVIELAEKSKRLLSTGAVIKKLQKQLKENPIKGAQIKVMRTPLRGIKKTSTSDIDIRIRGYNLDTLFEIAKDIQSRIKDVEGLGNLDVSVDFSRPEIHIFLNREKLSDFGLTAKYLSDVARTHVDGLVSTQFTDKERNVDYDIRVLADPITVSSKEAIENAPIYPPSGVEVKLKEIATVEVSEGPVQIDRQDQVRLIEVTGDAAGKNVGKITDEIKKRLSTLILPAGYYLEYGGEEESAKESNAQLIIVIALAVFLLFVVMAVQYDSLIDPVIIMVTLPLALIGAFLLLAITRTPFGATVFLGLILLVGIVVNNAIVLVEYINNLRKEKQLAVYDAVIEGASLRVRPILMTSITTIIGLSPLVFGWGEGLEMLRPLAITVVGGLSVSMMLTLFVIPCVYTVFHKARL